MIRLAAMTTMIGCMFACSDASFDDAANPSVATDASWTSPASGTSGFADADAMSPEWYSLSGHVTVVDGVPISGSVFEFLFYDADKQPFCTIPMIVQQVDLVDAPDPGLFGWTSVQLASIWPDEGGLNGGGNSEPSSTIDFYTPDTGDTGQDTGDTGLWDDSNQAGEFPAERPVECRGIVAPSRFSFGFGPYDTAFEPAVYGQGWDATGLSGFYVQTSDSDPLWALGVSGLAETFGLPSDPADEFAQGTQDGVHRVEGLFLLPF